MDAQVAVADDLPVSHRPKAWAPGLAFDDVTNLTPYIERLPMQFGAIAVVHNDL